MPAAHEVDAQSGCRMVGGELWEGTDLGTRLPSPALARLVATVAGGAGVDRVLLAGPLAPALAEVVDAREVHLLLRRLPDARAVAAAGRPVTVVAGAVDRLPDDEPFDVVVALGGPDLLLAPDSPPLDAAALLLRLRALVAPGGTLVADVANDAGVDRLLRAGPPPPAGSVLPALRAVTGPRAVRYAAYPGVDRPDALVRWPADPAADPAGAATARAVATPAMAAGDGDGVPLHDAWEVLERLADAGLGEATAPGWLVVDGPSVAALPPVLAEGGTPRAEGPLLETALRRELASPSRERLRDLVGTYAGWLATEEGARHPADPRLLVVTADGEVRPLLAGPGAAPDAGEPTARLARGLHGTAVRVTAAGVAHRWPPNTSPTRLTAELLAMVDVEAPDGLDGPGGAQADAGTVRAGSARAEAVNARDAGEAQDADVGAEAALADARRRGAELQELLDVRDRQVRWLEGTLVARDRQVRTLEATVRLDSLTARAVAAASRPVPALRRRVRAAIDRRRA